MFSRERADFHERLCAAGFRRRVSRSGAVCARPDESSLGALNEIARRFVARWIARECDPVALVSPMLPKTSSAR